MSLSDIVAVNISVDSAKVTKAGFGVPLILSALPAWAERVRSYQDIDGMISDGFTSSTPEYKMAQALFAQNPRPPTVLVGRQALKPTLRWAITPVAGNAVVYAMTIVEANGTEHAVSFTSDASGTVTEIIAGLKIAIDALSLAITVSDQTTYMRVVANVAGAFFGCFVADTTKLGIAMDHADPGLATDLAAIKLENDTWYGLLHCFNSEACIAAIAAWVETNKKHFIAQSQDSEIANHVLTAATDVAADIKTSAYARTSVVYHPRNDVFIDGAWDGRCLPLTPGSETWKFKTLAGIPAVSLTSTQRTNIKAKNCNFYEAVAGVNITQEGVTGSGEFIDVIRFRDWLEADMAAGVYGALVKPDKIPFTDPGVALIEAEVRASLRRGVDAGGIAEDPAFVVTVPKVSETSSIDRGNRLLKTVKFTATLAGAIHAVQISGNVSV